MTDATVHILRQGLWSSLVAASAWTVASDASAQTAEPTPFGTEIANTATFSYEVGNASVRAITNTAVFTVEPRNTPAIIDFFRYSPTATGAVPTIINGSDYSPDGTIDGAFSPIGAAVNPGGQVIDTDQPVPLIPATTYLAGEVMFVRVIDAGANRDSTAIDTLVITIAADTGDLITLRLYETGLDTGEFFAYINSTDQDTPVHA